MKLHPLTREIQQELKKRLLFPVADYMIVIINQVIWRVTVDKAEWLKDKYNNAEGDSEFCSDVDKSFGLTDIRSLYRVLREDLNTERTEEIIETVKQHFREHPEELHK